MSAIVGFSRGRARAGTHRIVLVGVVALAADVGAVVSQSTVVPTPGDIVWAEYSYYRLRASDHAFVDAILLDYSMHLDRQGLSEAQISERVAHARREFEVHRTVGQQRGFSRGEAMAGDLVGVLLGDLPGSAAVEFMRKWMVDLPTGTDDVVSLEELEARARRHVEVQIGTLLSDARERAKRDATYAALYARRFPSLSGGLPADASPGAIAAHDQVFGTFIDTVANRRLQQPGLTPGEREQLAEQMTERARGVIRQEMRLQHARMDSLVTGRVRAEEDRAMRSLRIEAANASIQIVGRVLTAAGDEELGRKFAALGQGGAQIAQSAIAFEEMLARTGGRGDVLGSIVLANNVLNAFGILGAAFQGGRPDPTHVLTRELRNIRRDLAELREAMDRHFVRVDQRLSAVFVQLDAIGRVTSGIDEDLGRARAEIAIVNQDVLVAERTALRAIGELWRTVLDTDPDLLNCLEARAAVGSPRISRDGFQRCIVRIREIGVDRSREPLATEPFGSLELRRAEDYLRGRPVLDALPYLHAQLKLCQPHQATSGSGMSSDSIVSPTFGVWADAVRKYERAVFDWPVYIREVQPGLTLNALRETGADLNRVAQETFLRRSSAGGLEANLELIRCLHGRYRAAAEVLESQIDSVAHRWRKGDQMNHRVGDVDLWEGADQPTQYNPRFLHHLDQSFRPPSPEVGAYHTTRWIPERLWQVLPRPALIGEQLGHGWVHVAWSSGNREQTIALAAYHYFPFSDRKWFDLSMRFWEEPRKQLTCDWNCFERADSATVPDRLRREYVDSSYEDLRRWDQDGNRFDVSEGILAHRDSVRARVDAFLDSIRPLVTAHVSREYAGTGEDVEPGRLATAAAELDGIVAVLRGIVRLGLPRSLEEDEFRALFFGSDRIMGGSDIRAWWSRAAMGGDELRGFRARMIEHRRQRDSAAFAAIERRVSAPGFTGETHPAVDRVLARLDAAEQLIRACGDPTVDVGRRIAPRGTASRRADCTALRPGMRQPGTRQRIRRSGGRRPSLGFL